MKRTGVSPLSALACALLLGLGTAAGVRADGIKLDEPLDALTAAAKKNDANAQYKLAIYNLYGVGMVTNEKEAVNLLKKAAGSGHAEAQHLLGFCYAVGDGMSKADEKEAVKWYQKAADQGHLQAEFKMGFCYERGFGVTKSDAEALKWYKKSADHGTADAQFAVGRFYYNGQGTAQDYNEAAKWYLKAANAGHKGAQYALGTCASIGQGVPRDYVEAYKWFGLAAEAGDEDALKRRDQTVTSYRLTAEQIADGASRIASFKPMK